MVVEGRLVINSSKKTIDDTANITEICVGDRYIEGPIAVDLEHIS